MKNINKNLEIWFYIVPFLIAWLAIIQISGISNVFSYETIKRVPDAVMYTGIFYLIFSRLLWQLKILHPWLVPYPNIQGTWVGTLESTWINPKTGKRIAPIPVQFCIKQDFESLRISMFTKESSSFSQAARFVDESDKSLSLSYTYSNKPEAKVRDRSEIHDGAAYIRIIDNDNMILKGEYWTSRKTTGDINIKKVSRNFINSFDEKIVE